MLERFPDVRHDGVGQPFVPRRVVERFRVVAQVLVIQQAFDRRRPIERPQVHLRRAFPDGGDDVVGIRRRGREARVLEAIHAGQEPAADLLGPVRVRDDRLAARVRFVHDGAHFVHRHLVLVDQLDDVDSGVGDLLHLGASIVRSFDAPAVRLGVRIGLVLDEGTRDVERGARDLAGVDPIADGDTGLERPAEIARTGDAGHQQLLRGRRHDHGLELGHVCLVPVVVVGVADDHRMDVHVPEAGQNGHAFRGDNLGAGGHGERSDLADGGDLVTVDEDHTVLDRRTGEAVDEGTADESFRSGRLGWGRFGRDGGEGEEDGEEQAHVRSVAENKKSLMLFRAPGLVENNPGSDLLSHAVAHAVPSAVASLTSVFGMGTGVTLLL